MTSVPYVQVTNSVRLVRAERRPSCRSAASWSSPALRVGFFFAFAFASLGLRLRGLRLRRLLLRGCRLRLLLAGLRDARDRDPGDADRRGAGDGAGHQQRERDDRDDERPRSQPCSISIRTRCIHVSPSVVTGRAHEREPADGQHAPLHRRPRVHGDAHAGRCRSRSLQEPSPLNFRSTPRRGLSRCSESPGRVRNQPLNRVHICRSRKGRPVVGEIRSLCGAG